MAFINPGGTGVIAFAEYEDVKNRDQRLFEANEFTVPAEFTDLADMVESYTERATTKIRYLIKDTDWWMSFYINQSGSSIASTVYSTSNGRVDVPPPEANKFLLRQQDWTDLCVYYTLYEYVLPLIADFSNEDNAEYRKIGFYREKFDKLFSQLIAAGDWYDFNGTGTITTSEKAPTAVNLVRMR